MKLYFIAVVLGPPSGTSVILAKHDDLSSFSFFQRLSIAEFMAFTSTFLAQRTQPGERICIGRDELEENTLQESKLGDNIFFHVYKRSVPEHLAAVVITDRDYPQRPASSLLTKVLDDFTTKVPVSSFGTFKSTDFPEIEGYIEKYKDPRQADTIMKVQQELDETKIVLHKTIESVLQRGEKLDDLVDRSQELSFQSRMFYKTAKKQNSCCVIM